MLYAALEQFEHVTLVGIVVVEPDIFSETKDTMLLMLKVVPRESCRVVRSWVTQFVPESSKHSTLLTVGNAPCTYVVRSSLEERPKTESSAEHPEEIVETTSAMVLLEHAGAAQKACSQVSTGSMIELSSPATRRDMREETLRQDAESESAATVVKALLQLLEREETCAEAMPAPTRTVEKNKIVRVMVLKLKT